MILGFPDRFQIFFVLALVLDQGGDGKPCDGKPESAVSARDRRENIKALGLAG